MDAADGLPACPRCGGAKTGSVWGRPLCLRCHGETIRLARGGKAAGARHRATLARIAQEEREDGMPLPAPARTVVVRRETPPSPPPPAPDHVPTLRERLRARREAEARHD